MSKNQTFVRQGWIGRGPLRPRGLLIWVVVGASLIAVSVAVMPFDRAWSDAIAFFAEDGGALQRVLKLPYYFFARWGFVVVPFVLLAYRDRWRLLIGFGAAMAAGAPVHLLKFLIGRARPERGFGPFDFHPFGDPRLQFDSFPSAHAVYATMLAALLGLYSPRWRPVLIPLAGMVCVARVAQERHFVSDVIAGVGFGLIIVYLLARGLGPKYYHRLGWPTRKGSEGVAPPSSDRRDAS